MYERKLGANLTELRNEKGVTQEDVANALQVSNKTISKWETGASEPDIAKLVKLSEYFHVTIDTLLGLNDKEQISSQRFFNELNSFPFSILLGLYDEFKDLNRRESVLKAFEISKALFPVCFEKWSIEDDNKEYVIPIKTELLTRYQVSMPDFYNFVVCSDDVNLAVMLLRNKSDFSWLKEEYKQNKIIKLFSFLADKDALNICAFIHTAKCSENFSAEYISANTKIDYDKTVSVLEEACEINLCTKKTAHLKEGDVTVYASVGDGMILSIISLVYEKMCGQNSYNYAFQKSSKMIGG